RRRANLGVHPVDPDGARARVPYREEAALLPQISKRGARCPAARVQRVLWKPCAQTGRCPGFEDKSRRNPLSPATSFCQQSAGRPSANPIRLKRRVQNLSISPHSDTFSRTVLARPAARSELSAQAPTPRSREPPPCNRGNFLERRGVQRSFAAT